MQQTIMKLCRIFQMVHWRIKQQTDRRNVAKRQRSLQLHWMLWSFEQILSEACTALW